MNIRQRAMILTGVAFPLGSILGVVFGRLTAPSSGGGFADIVYTILWFLVGAPLLSVIAFFWSTRGFEWSPGSRPRATLTFALGVLLATGVLFVLLYALSRGANGAWVFVALPSTAWLVARFTSNALQA